MKAIKRVPEPQVLKSCEDIFSYQKESGRGIIAIVERMFVGFFLERFGSRPTLEVLDIGTGPGWIPIMISRRKPHWNVTAVDALAEMVACAKQTAESEGVRINWVQAQADRLGFSPQRFDVVISHFAFHEFSDPVAVLKEMGRVLKKNGTLVIQDLMRPTPFLFTVIRLWGIFYSRAMRRQYPACLKACYTPEELKGLLREAGFESEIKTGLASGMRAICVKS